MRHNEWPDIPELVPASTGAYDFGHKKLVLADAEVHLMSVTSCGWTGALVNRDGLPYISVPMPLRQRVSEKLGFKDCGHEGSGWSTDGLICHRCNG